MTYNWQDHWKRNEIAFHLNATHPLLEKYWPLLKVATNVNVLVPLCGKTVDMLWLANQGYHVIGVELSEIACEAFFVENKLSFSKTKKNEFVCYCNDQIKLYCGDFFALSTEVIPEVTAVYDRAALIALPEELRQRYVSHMTKLMGANSKMLLITYDSPDIVQGPPYSVSSHEVNHLFSPDFKINELARIQENVFSNHLRKKGYKVLNEVVYQLEKM